MSLVNLSLQIVPAVPEEDIYPVVDKVIALIKESGVKHIVGPMETTMEGDMDTLLDIVKKSHEICARAGASRVLSFVKIDHRPGGDITMDEKVGKYQG